MWIHLLLVIMHLFFLNYSDKKKIEIKIKLLSTSEYSSALLVTSVGYLECFRNSKMAGGRLILSQARFFLMVCVCLNEQMFVETRVCILTFFL